MAAGPVWNNGSTRRRFLKRSGAALGAAGVGLTAVSNTYAQGSWTDESETFTHTVSVPKIWIATAASDELAAQGITVSASTIMSQRGWLYPEAFSHTFVSKFTWSENDASPKKYRRASWELTTGNLLVNWGDQPGNQPGTFGYFIETQGYTSGDKLVGFEEITSAMVETAMGSGPFLTDVGTKYKIVYGTIFADGVPQPKKLYTTAHDECEEIEIDHTTTRTYVQARVPVTFTSGGNQVTVDVSVAFPIPQSSWEQKKKEPSS